VPLDKSLSDHCLFIIIVSWTHLQLMLLVYSFLLLFLLFTIFFSATFIFLALLDLLSWTLFRLTVAHFISIHFELLLNVFTSYKSCTSSFSRAQESLNSDVWFLLFLFVSFHYTFCMWFLKTGIHDTIRFFSLLEREPRSLHVLGTCTTRVSTPTHGPALFITNVINKRKRTLYRVFLKKKISWYEIVLEMAKINRLSMAVSDIEHKISIRGIQAVWVELSVKFWFSSHQNLA
jgi:hypothetical protein